MLAGRLCCCAFAVSTFSPPTVAPAAYLDALRRHGHAVLDAGAVRQLAGIDTTELEALSAEWQALAPDEYLRDGGRYRHRRHASAVVEQKVVMVQPARAHWQPLDYNALHGGIERWFAPMTQAAMAAPALLALLRWLAHVADQVHGPQPWYAEVHAFRIDTADGIGRPTPEGAHRDGVDLVAVFLVAREAIKGGETRVFALDGPQGQRFTLAEPWSVLLMDDTRVIHETTPIQSADPGQPGHRDTLVVTLRRGGFLAPPR
ncbi:2OG-Fe dioxygenase family protein [Ottowia sp. GY511]|uniref:2OG-Fe dioxygenase family protein n=1 Tax=Ottowia flava TaxID=2675430 RepID=A0ABW4KP71_9BURK|nr:2OG-Fe dioxygenase family protein [Ottowia sp. GY511]TXK24919.1 2OG-Fe dioxygenase family protein [Ottowia sp. GY511]